MANNFKSGKIEFGVGDRSAIKTYLENDGKAGTDSVNAEEDILFAKDSGTIFTKGVEFGSYMANSSIPNTETATTVGNLSGVTREDLAKMTLSEVLDNIFFKEYDPSSNFSSSKGSVSGGTVKEVGTTISTSWITVKNPSVSGTYGYIKSGSNWVTDNKYSDLLTQGTYTKTISDNLTTVPFDTFTISIPSDSVATFSGVSNDVLVENTTTGKYELATSRGNLAKTSVLPASATTVGFDIDSTSQTFTGIYYCAENGSKYTKKYLKSDGTFGGSWSTSEIIFNAGTAGTAATPVNTVKYTIAIPDSYTGTAPTITINKVYGYDTMNPSNPWDVDKVETGVSASSFELYQGNDIELVDGSGTTKYTLKTYSIRNTVELNTGCKISFTLSL